MRLLQSINIRSIAALAMAAILGSGLLYADQYNNTTSSRTGVLDSKTTGPSVRVSKLIGKSIENSQEKSVGTINDIVMNSRTGKIQYLAVTYGGFLGVGNKMFAVPFEAIRVTKDPDDPNDPDDFVLVMDVTQQQLEGAKGFDEDKWPNAADKDFTSDLYQRYDVKPNRHDGRRDPRGVDVTVGRNGVDVNVNRR